MATREKKTKECSIINTWKNRQKTFTQVTDERVKDCIKELQGIRWKRNRRRLEHQKPSKIPQVDAKSTLMSYNRLIQFRRKLPEMAWLEILRSVTLMISAYGAMKKRGCLLERLTFRNVMDQYRVAVNTTERGVDGAAVSINYNYKDYTVSKAMSVPADVVKIMQKNPVFRTHQDIMTIYTIMMNLPVFQNNYTYDQCWTLAKNLKYLQCETKRVLTLRNRNPILVYFIYAGTVNVVVELESNQLFANPKRIITLTRGASIGHKSKTPLSICATNCEFLTIEKSVYIKEGIHAVQTQEMEERFNFFRNWPPLVNWSDNAIYDLAIMSYTDSYPSGTMILQDTRDSASDLVWFVLQGKMEVVKVASHAMCTKSYPQPKSASVALAEIKSAMAKFLDSTQKEIVLKQNSGLGVCSETLRESTEEPTGSLKSMTNYLLDNKPTESSKGQESIKRPIYLKMRSLLVGECYGLDNLSDSLLKENLNKTTDRFCLVSRDCSVIRVSCSQFMDLINILGIDTKALQRTVHSYADDGEICQTMQGEKEWSKYKQKLVESQVLLNQTHRKTQNFIDHLLQVHEIVNKYDEPDYLKPLKVIKPGSAYIISPYYTLATNMELQEEHFNRCISGSLPSV